MKNRYKRAIIKSGLMLAVMTTLMTGCIKNDVPFEIILGNITKMEIRGSESLTIDNANFVIDLVLADTVDLRNVFLDDFNITTDASIENNMTGKIMDTLDSYYLDLTQGGGIENYFIPNIEDSAYIFTVITYQDYEWKLKAKQNIERTFTLAGGVQIGDATFSSNEYSVAALVPLDVDLATINIEKLQLGPSNSTIAWINPDGIVVENVDYKTIHDFILPQKFIVKFFDITQLWTVTVTQSAQYITEFSVNPWAKFADLSSQGLTSSGDAGFEVRKVGDEDWTAVSDVVVDGGTFSAAATDLTPSTDYEARSFIDQGDGNVSYGDFIAFTTEAAEVVPNLDFDTWTEKVTSGKTAWYPNADATNSYWATGNDGVLIYADANSIPVEGADAVEGKAAELTTLGGVPLVKIAAGNLYTGTYKTNIIKPALSAVMGRPYTSRPTRLKGWYKYTPKVVTHGGTDYGSEVGQMDYCSIYIRLENWGTATVRPGSQDNPGTPASSIVEIAYAELEDNTQVSDYKQFDIKLEYYDTQTKPTHIVIVASSSRYGESFCGGPGSVLYVDQFELSFDY